MYKALAVLALLAVGPAAASSAMEVKAAEAGTASIKVADFASLPLLYAPLLSPDGKRIVARSTVDGHIRLSLLDADRPELPPKVIALGETNVAALRWAGNQRLLLTVGAMQKLAGNVEIPFLRLIAIDTATGAARLVDTKGRGIFAGDVLYADPSGSWALVASQDDIYSYPSVKRIDLATGSGEVIEKARDRVWDWYADDRGVVRAGIAYEGRNWTVWYRDKPEEKLRPIRGKFPKSDDSAVDRFIFRGNNNWIITNERTGRFGLYQYDVKSGTVGAAIFEHPEVDLDDVTYDVVTGEIVAAEYHDDRPRTLWLDEEHKALQARIDRALPNSTNLLAGWSADNKRVLVWSGGASDPGRYFLLDRATSRMHPVIDPYPRIEPAHLSDVKMLRYTSRDGLSIPAYVTLPRGREARNLPLVLLPHGGPFRRDKWEYDPLVQFLASRGYAVLQPQFRGSTGYGKDFVTKGYGEWGRKMQDDLDDGVDWLVRSGQVDPKRVCIVGASYGGYAAMWAAIRNPERYRCAASFAGVSDLPGMLRYDKRLFSASRYHREWRTKVGGEGKVDLAALSPLRFPERVKIPVLIGHGEKDTNVPVKQSREFVEAVTKVNGNVSSVFYKNSGHDFGSSEDLEDWLRRLEQFLTKHNPA